jgi:hypothetical protein
LNYVIAKKDGSEFLVRMDRHPDQIKYESKILEDMAAFGIIPDDIIFTRHREGRYLEVLDQILKTHQRTGQVYFCDCGVHDINYRGAVSPGKMAVLHREEKYPGPCKIKQVKVFNLNDPGKDYIPEAKVGANISNRYHPPENTLDGTDNYWSSKDVGYLGTDEPELTFYWNKSIWINKVEIIYSGVPLKALTLRAGRGTVNINKGCSFYYSPRLPDETTDVFTMAPMFADQLRIKPELYMYEVKKPYFYDRHCKERNIRTLPLATRSTTIRTCYDKEGFLPDAALWFEGQADLILTSIIDDWDYGIDVRVRGIDIQPFSWLEDQAAELVIPKEDRSNRGGAIPNLFHVMLLDTSFVKFSKFISSPPAVSYLEHKSPIEVLCYIARKLGMLQGSENVGSLDELVEACDLAYLEDNRCLITCRPEEELAG